MPAIYHYAFSVQLIDPPRARASFGDRADVGRRYLRLCHSIVVKLRFHYL